MKIVFRKRNGEVVMVGSTVENEALTTVEAPDDIRAKQGYVMHYLNNQLIFEKHPAMLEKEAEDLKEAERLADLEKVKDAETVDDLKLILERLLTK